MVRNKKKPENKSQQKKQTKKQKEDEEKQKQQQQPAIPPEIAQEFRRAGHRFLFNVEQIEKKYCQSSSGMVLNLDTEEYEFDNELCTGDTDEEIIEMINEQKRCLMAPIGEALLSTPAPDRDERDEERLKQCRELNKLCDEVYKQREAEAAEEKKQGNSSAKRCTALVPLGERQIRGGGDQQQGNAFAGFQSADENFLRLSFDMAGRFHIYGNISSFQGFASMLSNSNIPIKIPDEFRGRRLAIQPSMEENEEIGEEGMKKAEPQNEKVDSTGSSSSSRGGIKRKSEALNPKLLAIECGKADEEQVKRPRLEEAPCCSSTSGSYTPLPVVPQNHLEQPPSCKLPPSFFIPDTPINRIIMATGAKNGQNAQTLTSGSAEAEVVEQTPIEETRAALPPKKQQQQCQSVHSMTLRRANRKWLLGASTPAPNIGGGKAGLGGLGKPEARGAVSTMKRAKGRPRKIMMQ